MDNDERDYQPPTPEQWQCLPTWLKWWIFASCLFYSWESRTGIDRAKAWRRESSMTFPHLADLCYTLVCLAGLRVSLVTGDFFVGPLFYPYPRRPAMIEPGIGQKAAYRLRAEKPPF